MSEDWSNEEVSATVADYLAMLELELRGEAYSKREHNRRLQAVLRSRSYGAVEFKHANISAVLLELGFPYIDGYKPRANYQALLKNEVIVQLDNDSRLLATADVVVEAPALVMPAIRSFADVVVPAPTRDKTVVRERRTQQPPRPRKIDFLAREARNSSLGGAGEEFVLEMEVRRLWDAGLRELSQRVEHVSTTRGDGLGYDISSFELDGRERLIEVKTTTFGAMTPFYASAREVDISEELAPHFSLYRVFKFRTLPKIFILPGSLRMSCLLDPIQYRASLP
jgi:uncharacterized protein DUF3883